MKCSPTFANPWRLGKIFASIGVTSVTWLSWTWRSLLMGWQWATTIPYSNEAMIWQMQQGHTPSCLHATMWWQYALTQISHLMMMMMCPGLYHHHNVTVTMATMMTFWSCPPLYPWALLPVYDVMWWWWWWHALGCITTTAWWCHHCGPVMIWSLLLCKHCGWLR